MRSGGSCNLSFARADDPRYTLPLAVACYPEGIRNGSPMFSIKSPLFETPVADLRPTQITVGSKEVEEKRSEWAKLKRAARKKQMREELFPVVKGPGGHLYILDHHHAALALLQEGAVTAQAGLVKDLSVLTERAFWTFLDHFSWMHAYDARGHKRGFEAIPRSLEDLHDDPFRSFAGAVRDAGGFSKPTEPFQEFLWANFLRSAFAVKDAKASSGKALDKAVALAHSPDAKHLPGWCGTK